MRVSATVVGLAAGVFLVNAQSLGLSAGCTTAATGLLTGSASTCLNTPGLTAVIAGGQNESIVPAVQSYVSTLCAAAPCSSDTISSARNSIQSGCSSDIQSGASIAVLLNAIFSDYPDVRALVCSQYSSNSSYCLPSLLSAVQSSTGQQITVDYLEGLFNAGQAQSFLSNLPAGAVCNDCGHAIITLVSRIAAAQTSSAGTTVRSAGASKCGNSFNDNQIPSSVTTGGSSSSSRSNSGAVHAMSGAPFVALTGALVAALLGGMTLFA